MPKADEPREFWFDIGAATEGEYLPGTRTCLVRKQDFDALAAELANRDAQIERFKAARDRREKEMGEWAQKIAELEAERDEWKQSFDDMAETQHKTHLQCDALEKQVAELKALDKWNNSAAINKIKEERDALKERLAELNLEKGEWIVKCEEAREKLAAAEASFNDALKAGHERWSRADLEKAELLQWCERLAGDLQFYAIKGPAMANGECIMDGGDIALKGVAEFEAWRVQNFPEKGE